MLIYVPSNSALDTAGLQAILEDKLSKYKRPKYWIPPKLAAQLKVKSTANSYCK